MRVRGLAVLGLGFMLVGAAEPVRNIDYFQISDIDSRQGLRAVLDAINLTENTDLGHGKRIYVGKEAKTGNEVLVLTEGDVIWKVVYRFDLRMDVNNEDNIAALQNRYALDKLPGGVIEKNTATGHPGLVMRYNCDNQPSYLAACSIRFSYFVVNGTPSNEISWLNRPFFDEKAKDRQAEFEKKLP